MAWRDIADSEVDPESPVTTSLAQAWRDNPIGIANGDSGAPKVQSGGLASDAVVVSNMGLSAAYPIIDSESSIAEYRGSQVTQGSTGWYTILDISGPAVVIGGKINTQDIEGLRYTLDGTTVSVYSSAAQGETGTGGLYSVCDIPPAYGASSVKIEFYLANAGASYGYRILVRT